MSTEALAEIITVLRKYPSISTKVLLETTKQGILWTTISLRQSTGIQPSSSEKSSSRNSSKNPKKKIRKSPCRILRDKKRQEAYLSRKAGSLNKYTPPDPTLPRPPDPIISRLLPLDHQTTSESPTTPQPPGPTTHWPLDTPQPPDPTTHRPLDTPQPSDLSTTPQLPDLSATPPSMASCRKAIAGRSRGLEESGAGNEEEKTVWRPAVTMSPIPQIDGQTTPRPPETTTTPPDTTPCPPNTSTTPPDSPIDPQEKEDNLCTHLTEHTVHHADHDLFMTKGLSCHSCDRKILDVNMFSGNTAVSLLYSSGKECTSIRHYCIVCV